MGRDLDVRRPILVIADPLETISTDEARVVENSLARIRALLPPGMLQLLSLYLEAFTRERTSGGLDVKFNMHEGRYMSMDVLRRVHYASSQGVQIDEAAD